MTREKSEVKQDQASLDPLVYQALHTGTLGDIAFYCDLVREWIKDHERRDPLNKHRPWVLELGCGSGRLAIPLAEAGAKIIGVDDHEGLLKRAQIQLTHRCAELSEDEALTLSNRIDLRRQDFTELSHQSFPHITRGFDLILLPYNGLYCMLDEDTVIVQATQINLISLLEQKGFTVVPIHMRHQRSLGGGPHCCTVELEREYDLDWTLNG